MACNRDDSTPMSQNSRRYPLTALLRPSFVESKLGRSFFLRQAWSPVMPRLLEIVPKYVRRYGDTGDQWQIRFPGEPMIESVHLGLYGGGGASEYRGNAEGLGRGRAGRSPNACAVSSIATPLHIFGTWNRKTIFRYRPSRADRGAICQSLLSAHRMNRQGHLVPSSLHPA